MRRATHSTCRQAGLTLIELLVVVGIVAVLAGLAAPSVNEFIMGKRVDTVANEMLADLRMARSTTTQTNEPVMFSFQNNGTLSCYTIYARETASGACDCSRGVGKACTGDDAADIPNELKTLILPASSGIKLVSSAAAFRFSGVAQQSLIDELVVDVAPSSNDGAGGALRLKVNRTGRSHLCAVSGHTAYGACK